MSPDVGHEMIVWVVGERDWRSAFEESYAGAPSAVAERVWRQVFGDEYPVGVDPYSYISVSELERSPPILMLELGA